MIKDFWRVGIIGCGAVAQRHATAMQDEGTGLKLGIVYDTYDHRARQFCDRFRVASAATLEEILRADVELICVCTPNDTHTELAAAALVSGKHVVVEHPLALTPLEAEHLCCLAAESDRRLFVMRQRRYLPTIQNVRLALNAGHLGTLRNVEAIMLWSRTEAYFAESEWRGRPQSGGVMVNQASHFLDILLYLFGSYSVLSGARGSLRHRLHTEDTAMGTIGFMSGVEASFFFTVSECERNVAVLTVEGDQGSLQLGGKEWEQVLKWNVPTPFRPSPTDEGTHKGFLSRVDRRLRGHDIEIVEGGDALGTVQLIDEFYRSVPLHNAQLLGLMQSVKQVSESVPQ